MLKHWPPLNALRGFEAAARLGSFHKAAEELHLTQSAISQQIRSLETFLEQPLFFRNGRSVSLTDAGYDLQSTTQAMLQQLSVGIRRLEQYRKPNQLVVNTTRRSPGTGCCRALGTFIVSIRRLICGCSPASIRRTWPRKPST